jgi:hypothetical protein
MNFHLTRCVLTLGLAVCATISAEAQNGILHASQVLPGGTRCENVIHLMHLHGVNNSVNQTMSASMLHHSPLGSMIIPGGELGDLEVIQVTQVLHDDPACGPKIAVIVQNQSVRKVCDFHISAVAILGRICPTSPNTTVRVEKLEPGEALEVCLHLPIEAFAMGNRNGQIIGFQRLVVAIDSYDEFVETNEANNVKAFDRSTLQLVSPTVEQPIETISGTTETGVVQETARQDVNVDIGSTGVNSQTPAPDALQSAIRKLGVDQSGGGEATNLQ